MNVKAKIRMYRLNELGDCFLITFSAGDDTGSLLVDCGSFRNGADSIARLKEVVTKGIEKDLDGKSIDVVVGTHQHNDHLSGFVHCENEFKKIEVGQVWLSWLDDPKDKTARKIGHDYNNIAMHLAAARRGVKDPSRLRSAESRRALNILDDVLGFYGAHAAKTPPKLPAEAVGILRKLGKQAPRFLKPGQSLDMPGLPPGSVRVHVLGPPRAKNAGEEGDPLFRKDPKKGESYDHSLKVAGMSAYRFMAASKKALDPVEQRAEENYPFNSRFKRKKAPAKTPLGEVMRRYRNKEEEWRLIDDDWLQQAESLALWLDTFTNNSSLVLAIELVESGKVLLFAADAQTGNWASWKDVKWKDSDVSTESLLERTVFYKVGHHASHNATLPEVFDKVTSQELVALIPVHKKDPNIAKSGGWKMPARNLFKKLVESTNHRVLQMDGLNPPNCDPKKEPSKSSWKKVGIKPTIGELSVDLEIKG